jgi:hypothetical protein
MVIDGGDGSGADRKRNGRSSGPKAARQLAPEALVQHEDRALHFLKFLFVLVLLGGAGAAASFIFIFTKESQKRSFESDFSLISQSIAETLVDDTAFFFKSSRSISTALTIIMEAYNSTQLTLSVPIPKFSSLTQDVNEYAFYATWNPFIKNDEERRQFEDMVRTREQEGYFSDGVNPPCYVCGDETMKPSTPTVQITFPGVGTYSCSTLDGVGRTFLIDEASCLVVTKAAIEGCSCSRSHAEQNETRVSRKPSEGIFRISDDGNKSIIDESWTGGPYMPMWMDGVMMKRKDPLLFDHLTHPKSAEAVSNMLFSGYPQVSKMYDGSDSHFFAGMFKDRPGSTFFYPVKSPYGSEIVGESCCQTIPLFCRLMLTIRNLFVHSH